jgi:hypothetical protein
MSYDNVVHQFDTHFIYIGQHPSRFTYGCLYKAVAFTTGPDSYIRVIDKDGVPMDIDRDMFDSMFITKSSWRNLKLDQLGI